MQVQVWLGVGPGRSLKRSILAILLVLVAGSVVAGTAGALDIDGRLSSSSFVSETYPDDQDEQERQWDLINRFSLNARQLGHNSLSLHWLGTHRGELLIEGIDKSRAKTYHGYLRVQPLRSSILTLGRQWVYGGVGSGRLDGARLQLAESRLGRLTLFAGTRGFLDPAGDSFEGIDKDAFNDSGIWGASYRSAPLPGNLAFGLSAARLFRAKIEEAERLGVYASWEPLTRSKIEYEHRYDLGQEISYYHHLRLSHRPGAWSTSLTWNRREGHPPSSDQSYIARYFRDRIWFTDSFSQLTDEIRGHFRWPCKLLKGWSGSIDILEIFPDGEDRGDGLQIGYSRPGYSFGYRLQRGFGGDQDGLYGGARYAVFDRTWIWLDLNKIYYRFGEIEDLEDEIVTDDESLATRFGVDALIPGGIDITTAVEVLRNPRAEHEVRILGRIGYRFQQSWPGGGE